MRILAIADRAPTTPIKETLASQKIDLICTLGDLDAFMLADLKAVTDIPKLGVYGNHCSGMYFENPGITDIHLKTFAHMGVTFGGFEGSLRYKESRTAKVYTQEEAQRLLADFPRVDVMLVHCPPYGVNDEPGDLTHEGFIGLRDYVLREKPKQLFHGHTYPKAGQEVTRLGETEIVYAYGDKVIKT